MNKESFDETPVSIEIFSTERGDCQLPLLDWERERNRASAFFELDWDTIEELPFNDVGDPHVNDRCMAEALAFCEERNIEPELWGLVYI